MCDEHGMGSGGAANAEVYKYSSSALRATKSCSYEWRERRAGGCVCTVAKNGGGGLRNALVVAQGDGGVCVEATRYGDVRWMADFWELLARRLAPW